MAQLWSQFTQPAAGGIVAGVGGVSNILFPINQIGIADGGPLNIDIAELIIYDSALSTSNIQLLYHNYFKPKFALP